MAPPPQNEKLISALQARVALASVNNDIPKRAAFTKAVHNVTAHKKPITTAVDIGTVKGIGQRIQKLLEKVLNGEEPEIPADAQEAMDKGHDIPQGWAYIPGQGTGARAILIALFRESKKPGHPGFMTKDQVQAAATATGISNTSMYPQPNLRNFYSAWSGMKTLCDNGLATRTKNGIGNHQHFALTDEGRRLAFFLEEQIGQQGGGPARDDGAVLPQSFSPPLRRLSGHTASAQRYQLGPGGFPEVMVGRGREIERGSDLLEVAEVGQAAAEDFRLYKAVCKSSTAARKKYKVQLHARVKLARGSLECEQAEAMGRVFAGRIPELVSKITEMGFNEESVWAALVKTGYNEELAVQQLLEGESVPGGSGAAVPGGVSEVVVVRSECNCPEGKSSNGKCKHAAALFLRVEDHVLNGAELNRAEPSKKAAKGKRQALGEDGLQVKAAPKRRKKAEAVEAVEPAAEKRNLAAVAAQLARSAPLPDMRPGTPKQTSGPRTPPRASPREMAAQAALERAAMQDSLRQSRPAPRAESWGGGRQVEDDLVELEEGLGWQAREPPRSYAGGAGAFDSQARPSLGKRVTRDKQQSHARVGEKGTSTKGKAVAFIDLDSDDDIVPTAKGGAKGGREVRMGSDEASGGDPDSEEDAALLSTTWRSPTASRGSGGSGPSERETGNGNNLGGAAGPSYVRNLDWSMEDAMVDPVELDRIVNKVSAAAVPDKAPAVIGNNQGHSSGQSGKRPSGNAGARVKQVTVIVDETERQTNNNPNSVYLELHRQHAALTAVAGVGLAVQKHKLEIGDYLWLADTEEGSFVLDTVVERKTMADLVTRSVTNAHLKQLRQMRASGLPNVCLLLEGDFRNARSFVAAAGQNARGDVDSAEAVWQLMAELLVGTAEGVTVPQGVTIGAGKSGPAPVRVLQTKDVKGTCKLLTHISAALAARMGEGREGGGREGRNGMHGFLEDFNKEARKRRTHMNKLVKLAEKEGIPEDGIESERDVPGGTVRDSAEGGLDGASAGLSERGGPLADSGGEERPCDECESRRAAMDCVECEQALCTQCSGRIHSKGARQSHLLTALGPARQCEECEAAAAGVSCTECEQSLCQSCSEKIHSKGARARHHIAPLSLSRVERLVPPGTGSHATFPSASSSRGGVGERSGQRENPSGRGLGKRSGVHIQASSKVCSLLRPLDLGPELVLEQTEFICPETISGSASEGGSLRGQVERAMYVDVAGQDEGRGGGEERRPCWVGLVKGDAFLQNMILAQVAVSGSSPNPCPEADLLAATALFLSALPEPPASTSSSPVNILVLENVLQQCRAMASRAERERLNGAAGVSRTGLDSDKDVHAFLSCHDLSEEMLRWIVRIMFSHKWNVQLTGNETESGVLFKHLAKAFVH